MIKLTDVSKLYRTSEIETLALEKVNLEINKGEFVSVMGPSGCGKSTLLNIIGLLDTPTTGVVEIDGIKTDTLGDASKTAMRNARLGFVFQSFHLIPSLNVTDNVELPLIYRSGISASERRERVREVLERVGLSHRMRHMPAQLSGGEQQRVSIARALAKNPKLLLCDEPTGALDYHTGKSILKLLQDTCRDKGMTVILITHNSAIAPMADRVIKIKNGRVAEILRNRYPVPVETIEW